MKPESLVIVGQPYHGEYVLKLCTHQPMCLVVCQVKSVQVGPALFSVRSERAVDGRETAGGEL